MIRMRLTILYALCVIVGQMGCSSAPNRGYSFGSTYDESIRTIALPMFANGTMHTGLEAQLAEAIAREVRSATPWAIVRAENADTTLTGSITDARYDTLSSRRGTGLPEEQAFHITARFEWTDNRTGRTLASHDRFNAAGTSIPSRPVSERPEVGQRQAIQDLARAIVDQLRASW